VTGPYAWSGFFGGIDFPPGFFFFFTFFLFKVDLSKLCCRSDTPERDSGDGADNTGSGVLFFSYGDSFSGPGISFSRWI